MSLRQFSRLSVLSLVIALSACSLEQRSADSGMVRIQLNTLAHSGGPSRLGTLTGNGMSLPTASSYYMVDVEGEGIPRQIFEPSKCVQASPLSSALVAASPAPGEPERTEIELLVPVGANRKIRIIRVDLNIPGGSAFPEFGENPFRFKMRNPSYSVNPNLFILAEADIPFLNGDQSVTLIEKASPLPLPNQCFQFSGGNQPSIANADVELLNYEPWEGVQSNGQAQPYAIWESNSYPHYLMVRGDFKNRSQSTIYPSGVVTPISVPAPTATLGGAVISSAGGSSGQSGLTPQSSRLYQWIFPVSSPAPGIFTASAALPYSVGASGTISAIQHQFSVQVHSSPAPVTIGSPTQIPGYSNVYRSVITFSGNGVLSALNEYSSLFSTANKSEKAVFEAPGVGQFFGTEVNSAIKSIATDGSQKVYFSYQGFLKSLNEDGTSSGYLGFASGPLGLTVTSFAKGIAVRGSTLYFVVGGGYIYQHALPLPASGALTNLKTLFDAGAGSGAQLGGITFDTQGNLYASDSARHVVIKLNGSDVMAFASSGVTLSANSVVAGVLNASGSLNGGVGTNRLTSPAGIAFDGKDRIVVIDGSTTRVRRIGLTTLNAETLVDLPGLKQIAAMDGDVYVTQGSPYHVVHRIRNGITTVHAGVLNSGVLPTIAGKIVTDTSLVDPDGITIGTNRKIYVGHQGSSIPNYKMVKISPPCPVSQNGMREPSSFQSGDTCDLFYRVFEAGTGQTLNDAAPARPPLVKLEVADASGKRGYLTPPLIGVSPYPTGLSKTARVVYDASPGMPTTVVVSKPLIDLIGARNGSTWALTGLSPIGVSNNCNVEKVWFKSNGGFGSDTSSVTAGCSTSSQIQLPRRVNAQPIREAEVVVEGLVGANLEHRKQRIELFPINPAQVDLRLERNDVVLGTGFTICTGDTGSYKLRAFYGTTELPLKDDVATTLSVTGFSPGSVTLTSNSNVLGLQLNMSPAFTAGSITFTVNSPRLLGIGGSGQETYIPLVNSKTWTGVVVGAGCSVGAGATPTPAPALDFQN